MVFELRNFVDGDEDYIEGINANNDGIATEINTLKAIVSATSGAGSVLLQDLFDRPGVVGTHSYQLDIDSFAGGGSIDIGRRPAPFLAAGETDVSIAWGLFSSVWDRVSQSGDVTLNAAGIVAGLPKTIYAGVPSSGIAQLYEDGATPNVVMLYSMSWDGADLSDFKRLAHILPGYSLLQAIAGAPRKEQVMDGETDFRDGNTYGDSVIVLPGAAAANGISLDGAQEIVGIFLDIQRDDEDGWFTNSAGDPDESKVTLQVVDEDDDEYCTTDIEIDCADPVGTVFKAIASGIGDKKYSTTARNLRLKLKDIGDDVVSARCFTWGIWTRPLLGNALPKDTTKVKSI